ncbi:3-isopropylmalate dehydrogenase [Alicyclobacillus sp. ALC3]|uniref:3-isopropylmalate dehydrogenase n=1 Tax=Alicyclobacillus sp. ALC3 TaxID=2796143 RepID=UPI002378E539|nr:3-isopropylmalate dehydrogenase [Alicyclobacillus sp. ALC3]WDL97988.1 3-isopropylmalate dehydrogenase [Alicyclobacillus sp. ALC3]
MIKHISVLPGDGIGPEVTNEACRLLETVGAEFGHTFSFTFAHIGGAAIDAAGTPLPEETIAACRASDAVLLGAVGAPQYDRGPASGRPEAGLLGLRKALGVFANLRPITVFPALAKASPLKDEILKNVDFLIVRELTGGLYFGTPRERIETPEGLEVIDTLRYTEHEIERIIRLGYETARTRGRRLTSVDKANVLESSRVWRETVQRLQAEYPDVELNHLLVDNAAMQIVKNPGQFDVMVTENLFGDILSDEGAMITGSIGMLPSASLGNGGPGVYEPVHGSAPDIAGKGVANPLATFLSVALMLRQSLGMAAEADAVERAVNHVLTDGLRTADIADIGQSALGTAEMGDAVRDRLRAAAVKQ